MKKKDQLRSLLLSWLLSPSLSGAMVGWLGNWLWYNVGLAQNSEKEGSCMLRRAGE
jgi:hypothetical protein